MENLGALVVTDPATGIVEMEEGSPSAGSAREDDGVLLAHTLLHADCGVAHFQLSCKARVAVGIYLGIALRSGREESVILVSHIFLKLWRS